MLNRKDEGLIRSSISKYEVEVMEFIYVLAEALDVVRSTRFPMSLFAVSRFGSRIYKEAMDVVSLIREDIRNRKA